MLRLWESLSRPRSSGSSALVDPEERFREVFERITSRPGFTPPTESKAIQGILNDPAFDVGAFIAYSIARIERGTNDKIIGQFAGIWSYLSERPDGREQLAKGVLALGAAVEQGEIQSRLDKHTVDFVTSKLAQHYIYSGRPGLGVRLLRDLAKTSEFAFNELTQIVREVRRSSLFDANGQPVAWRPVLAVVLTESGLLTDERVERRFLDFADGIPPGQSWFLQELAEMASSAGLHRDAIRLCESEEKKSLNRKSNVPRIAFADSLLAVGDLDRVEKALTSWSHGSANESLMILSAALFAQARGVAAEDLELQAVHFDRSVRYLKDVVQLFESSGNPPTLEAFVEDMLTRVDRYAPYVISEEDAIDLRMQVLVQTQPLAVDASELVSEQTHFPAAEGERPREVPDSYRPILVAHKYADLAETGGTMRLWLPQQVLDMLNDRPVTFARESAASSFELPGL